tara:strand:+ start:176 stop:844 length:669 start_codon:yes stop_codon:yes gene_type:complete
MKYKNFVVKKPWGKEYLVCETKNTATWYLDIKKGHKTSLHCHPQKKTGFVLLEGKVEVMLGFYEKRLLKAPAKLMIRPGLFHSTKSISKSGAKILEIETPIKKEDLVRFKDSYGRSNKPYEGKNKMIKKTNKDYTFNIPKIGHLNKYNFKDGLITIEKYKSLKKLKRKPKNTIFAILDGGLADKKNRYVLSPADLVRLDTIKKLGKVFDVNKYITFLTYYKK